MPFGKNLHTVTITARDTNQVMRSQTSAIFCRSMSVQRHPSHLGDLKRRGIRPHTTLREMKERDAFTLLSARMRKAAPPHTTVWKKTKSELTPSHIQGVRSRFLHILTKKYGAADVMLRHCVAEMPHVLLPDSIKLVYT